MNTPVSPELNKALGMQEFREGKLVVQSTPNLVTLETTSRCNLRCVMCLHAINGVDRPKHLDEVLTAKLGRFLGQAGAIQLHGIGEPLNSPSFWTCLADLPAPELCESSINTNFAVINDVQLDRLVTSNIRLINVSLDAATASTYQKIRGYDFAKVLENIRRFTAKKLALGKNYPLLYLNMTLMRSNIEELEDFVLLAKEHGANQVCAWHLNHWPDQEMRRFVVKRDGWVFDYEKEGLWNFPELSNQCIGRAQERASQLGIPLWLPSATPVFFKPDLASDGND